jgi:hypothetical protein
MSTPVSSAGDGTPVHAEAPAPTPYGCHICEGLEDFGSCCTGVGRAEEDPKGVSFFGALTLHCIRMECDRNMHHETLTSTYRAH